MAACPVLAGCATSPTQALKPVKIYVMAGQSNIEGPGSNRYIEKNVPELLKPREDVWCVFAGRVSGPLKPGYGFRYQEQFGPELKFGHVLGDALDNEIVIIKSAIGGTTLHRHWRPPSTVKRAGGKVGPLYNAMIRRVHNLLAHLGEVYPKYKGQGYELAGFVWFQGENDSCTKEKDGTGFWTYYQENLMDLIKDVRSELVVPNLPFLIAQIIDSDCWDSSGGGPVIRAAQEYACKKAENAAMIVTKDLDPGFHYDSPSHVVIGERLGKAMLKLSKKTVHCGEKNIRQAAKRFLERTNKDSEPDMRSLTKELTCYWKFDEGAHKTAHNMVPNGCDGKLESGAEWTRGKIGSAVKLVRDQSVTFPGFKETVGPSGNIENLSVSFWIRTPLKAGVCRIGKGLGRDIGKETDENWLISRQANTADRKSVV